MSATGSKRLRVVGISGSMRWPSKSRALIDWIARKVQAEIDVDFALFDILDAGPTLGATYARADLQGEAARIVGAIENADALIVASPVYNRLAMSNLQRLT